MAVDGKVIGVLAAEVMELLEAAQQEGYDLTLGTVAIVVETTAKNVAQPEIPDYTNVLFKTNESRGWVQYGFFMAAARAALDRPSPFDQTENGDT